jgi:hypothetical protein
MQFIVWGLSGVVSSLGRGIEESGRCSSFWSASCSIEVACSIDLIRSVIRS